MIVYVESNFILELAFAQDEASSCEDVLDLAETRAISLVLPAYSIAECYEALLGKSRDRSALQYQVTREFQHLGRSQLYAQVAERSQGVVDLLIQSGVEQKRYLEDVVTRTLNVAELVSIDLELFVRGRDLQHSHGLQPQDALIYAAVLTHLPSHPGVQKCFLNRNSKDPMTPDIRRDLDAYDCRVIPQFGDGVGYMSTMANMLVFPQSDTILCQSRLGRH